MSSIFCWFLINQTVKITHLTICWFSFCLLDVKFRLERVGCPRGRRGRRESSRCDYGKSRWGFTDKSTSFWGIDENVWKSVQHPWNFLKHFGKFNFFHIQLFGNGIILALVFFPDNQMNLIFLWTLNCEKNVWTWDRARPFQRSRLNCFFQFV